MTRGHWQFLDKNFTLKCRKGSLNFIVILSSKSKGELHVVTVRESVSLAVGLWQALGIYNNEYQWYQVVRSNTTLLKIKALGIIYEMVRLCVDLQFFRMCFLSFVPLLLILKDEQRNVSLIHVGIFFVTVNTFTSKEPNVCCSDSVYLTPTIIPVAMTSFVTSVALMSYIGDVFCRWQNWLNSI